MAIITISQGTYSGGVQLAQALSEKLGYTCLSREKLLSDAAAQYGVRDEDLTPILNNQLASPLGGRLWTTHYIAFITAVLCRAVKRDNVVYHGQAGHLLLTDVPHVLRIRVIADMEFRIKAACERHNITRDEAAQLIKKVDQERARWMVSIYQADWNDAALCDLVINLEHMSITAACELVAYAAQGARYQTTPESQKVLDDLLLAANVRAIIASVAMEDPEVKDYEVKVLSDHGVVTIKGKTGSQQEMDKIIKIAGGVPGVREVNSNMRIRTSEEADILNLPSNI